MKRFYFLLILHITFFNSSFSQVRVVKFDTIDSIIHARTDTVRYLNFWASWCQPCLKEIPILEEIRKAYSGQKFKMTLVSLDFKRDLNSRVLPVVADNDLGTQVFLLDETDYNSWINRVDSAWSGGLPVSLIIDSSNKKHLYEKEFTSYMELDSIVKPLIPKK